MSTTCSDIMAGKAAPTVAGGNTVDPQSILQHAEQQYQDRLKEMVMYQENEWQQKSKIT